MPTAGSKRLPWLGPSAVALVLVLILLWLVFRPEWFGGQGMRGHQVQREQSGEHKSDMDAMPGMDMEHMPGMKMDVKSTAKEGGTKSEVPGYAAVTIEPGLQQRIGVTIGEVKREPLRMKLRAVGILQPDETKTARIHLRTKGWVEKLLVNFTGQTVKAGDPLLAIYSPEFLVAEDEYLIALGSDTMASATPGSRSLAETALQKLELLGVPQDEIKELARTKEPSANITLRSPIDGIVLKRNVLQGEYVTPETELYVVSDLSTVWAQAHIYQYELPHVELGQPATVLVPGLTGKTFKGKLVFVQPTVEAKTRTVQVRIELPNPEGVLKPDMFVDIEIEHPMGDGLLVPATAVFRTGERDIVFRSEPKNRFVPVEVQLDEFKFAEDRYHVVDGLKAGDRIITSANFLIDSESRLRAGGGGMAGMAGMDMGDMKDMQGMKEMKAKQGMKDMNGMKDVKGKENKRVKAMDHSKMKP